VERDWFHYLSEGQSRLPQADESSFQYCAVEGLGIPTSAHDIDWNGTSIRAPDFIWKRLPAVSIFYIFAKLRELVIPTLVIIIRKMDFFSYQPLKQVICSPDGKVREIYGFNECSSLERIEIPSSVEIIGCRTEWLIIVCSQLDVMFNDYGF
jgi:hypothetical protein